MKIGLVYFANVNAYYRAIWPVRGLSERGHDVAVAVQQPDARLDMRSIRDCDVVFVYRARYPVLTKALIRLRQQGAAVVYDNDDDHRLMPKGLTTADRYTGFAGQRGFQQQAMAIRQADVLTTTSEFLAERLADGFGGHVRVIENYLSPQQFVTSRPPHEGIVIGWVGALEHRVDAQVPKMTEVLRRVMERDHRVRVETLGVRLSLDSPRYTYAGVVPFEGLAPHISRWDIGLAPIADIPFNYARSNVKVKEYSAAGVPWAASDRGPYACMGKGCGGILVTDDAWEEELVALVRSRLRRMRLRLQAQAWARTQRVDDHLDRWEDVLNLAIESAAHQPV